MKRFFIVFACTLFLGQLFGQDRHFTQFYAAPQTLNPAMAGNIEGTYRASIIYRDQWSSIIDNPFKTFSANFDLRMTPFGRSSGDAIGAGIVFFNDQAGISGFSTNQIAVSGAYHKMLDVNTNNVLSLGFQAGITQQDVNYLPLTFNDQFDGTTGYTLESNEILPENNFSYWDFSTGLFWSMSPEKFTNYHAGISLYHVNRPAISFYNDAELEFKLYRKLQIQAGASFPLSRSTQILPRILLSSQGPHFEINAGTNFRFSFRNYDNMGMYLGTWVRPVSTVDNGMDIDAIILFGGFETGGLLVGLSYDLNVSSLSTSTAGRGGFELSVTYIGEYENESVMCPKF